MRQLVLELAPPPAPTLANFVPGRNAAALAALRSALAGEERLIYLWGEPGSGRTHLLRAFIAAATRQPARYLAAGEDWGEVAALRTTAADDVSQLDERKQALLFDLCNRLRETHGALVAAGDVSPARLALREDLRTRLAAGVALALQPLDDVEKAAALRAHAARRGIALSEELIAYLLCHFARDMGTQIALLDALDRYSLERRRPLTLALAKEALQLLAERDRDSATG